MAQKTDKKREKPTSPGERREKNSEPSDSKRKKTTPGARPRKKISRIRKPEEMSLEEWQIALRRQYGIVQNFEMENIGPEPIFSEFMITNPETGGRYRVAIRGEIPGVNYCSCPDYSINTLGTCKHIEFTLARLREMPDAQTAFEKGFQPAYSEVYLRYGLTREVVFRAGADCPAPLSRLASKYFDRNGILKPAAFGRFEEFLKAAGGNGHELRCYDDAIQFIAAMRDQKILQSTLDRQYGQGPESDVFNHLLQVRLYGYQRQGSLFAAQAGRAVIADEMGLGKTIQALAACEILAQNVGLERTLIICPTSLKHQWKEEIDKFTTRSAEVVEGLKPRRRQCFERDSFYKIINYDVIHRDREYIRKWGPDMIILDEAQRIKNWKTRTAQSVKGLESQFALVLTGTPLENRLEELHSIVEFVDRFRLGPLFRFLSEHQVTDEADGSGKVVGYRNLSRITKTLSPILVRRSKNEVLSELPERIEKKYFVDMTDQQMDLHSENQEIVARIVAKWRRYKFLSDSDQRRLMIALQNMRMSCNSTYLLDHETDYGRKADELMTALEDVFQDRDAKVVVFSQWIRTHELILRRLNNNGWGHVFFHGGVPGPKRKGLIEKFKNDPDCRLFLATDAGGVGLNLQNATAVVIMDQPWNPAVLEQRIGRVHRLGQYRPVQVIHFIARSTIEHGMLSLLKFKQSLFTGVLDGERDEVFLGGNRLNQFMETVEKAADNIPEAVPQPDESMEDLAEDFTAMTAGKRTGDTDGPPAERLWQDVAEAGLEFLGKIGQVFGLDKERPVESAMRAASSLIERDESGQPYFKLPVPKPDTIQKVVNLLSELTGKK